MQDTDGIDHQYSIPYEECVEPSTHALILGDPFFKQWVVLHDLVDLNNRRMGLARRKPDYELLSDRHHTESLHSINLGASLSAESTVQRIRAKRRIHVVEGQQLASVDNEWNDDVVKLSAHNPTRVVYSIDISVGTPPQPMEVIFDTGSYM